MAYIAITSAEIASGKPVTGPGFGQKVKDDLDYLYNLSATISLGGIINGSFEIDSDSDGVPDNWIRNLYPGGTGSFYTTAPAHGARSWSFVHPGGASNGGGYLDGDYFEVSPQVSYILQFIMWATAAGMKNMVQAIYYDKDQVELVAGSPETLFTLTANPATATPYIVQFNPPATTCYAKLRLIGGYTDTDVAGTVYFDDIKVHTVPPIVVACISIEDSAEVTGGGGEDVFSTVKTFRTFISWPYLKLSAYLKVSGGAYARLKIDSIIGSTTPVVGGAGSYEWADAIEGVNVSSLYGTYQNIEIQIANDTLITAAQLKAFTVYAAY